MQRALDRRAVAPANRRARAARAACAAGRRLRRESFDVAHAVERLAHRVARARVAHERRHGVESRVDRRALDEWREKPLPQQPRAHRRRRAVEHGEQRALGAAAAQRLHQLEIAARHLVERHRCRPARSTLRTREMRQRRRAAARADSGAARPPRRSPQSVAAVDAEPVESTHAELPREIVARQRLVELPRFALGDERAVGARCAERERVDPRGTSSSRGASRASSGIELVERSRR